MAERKKDKLLIILRLFTGIESSILSRKWQPTGVPTIYKLIEQADKKFNCRIIFLSYGDNENILNFSNPYIKLDGLNSDIYVYKNYLKSKNIFTKILINLINLFKILRHCYDFKPNKIYLNNQNIIFAYFLKKFFPFKIIIRIMGIYQPMRDIYQNFSLKNYFMRKAYQSNYDFALVTQDGSGAEFWTKDALVNTKNIKILINGIDRPKKYKRYHLNKITNILFFGRLEDGKGILEFIEFAIKLNDLKKNKYEFTIIGTGYYEDYLNDCFKRNKIKFLHFKRISHSQIDQYLDKVDLYISLNKRGSLSNANLEVFRKGICSIILNSDKVNKIDIFTDSFINDDCLIRVDRNRIVDDLIELLLNNNLEAKLNFYSNNLTKFMKNNTQNWHKRIKFEIEKIENL